MPIPPVMYPAAPYAMANLLQTALSMQCDTHFVLPCADNKARGVGCVHRLYACLSISSHPIRHTRSPRIHVHTHTRSPIDLFTYCLDFSCEKNWYSALAPLVEPSPLWPPIGFFFDDADTQLDAPGFLTNQYVRTPRLASQAHDLPSQHAEKHTAVLHNIALCCSTDTYTERRT